MIEFSHVWKQYHKPDWALSDVSFAVAAGEMVFITGPSGSGKSTILRLMTRECPPTDGRILIEGMDIRRIPSAKIYILRRAMGVVFQDFRLLAERRVFDNVAVPLRVLGLPSKDVKRKVFLALRMVGLHHRIWNTPADLSYGEQQRVAIARAVVNNPRLLLADEPTGNLDPDLASEIIALFREINRQGTTVVICTHDREIVRKFAGRVLALREGRMRERGTAS
ncbi:MAG TPA: cell division ATP-binding protein FtsE [Candidatus Aminicenantes bacterium]|nr:cell division ATP-binding protein FtsE [Candidatus Aminicenantes bacterium]